MSGKNRESGAVTPRGEITFWGVLFGSVILDIFTKFLSDQGAFSNIPVLNGQVRNHGASFGLGSKFHPSILILIGIALVIALMIYRYRHISFKSDFVIALLIGGALGNQYDRMRWGYVRDFIQWPVFNIADVLICIGVGYFIIDTYYSEKLKKTTAEQKQDTDSKPS